MTFRALTRPLGLVLALAIPAGLAAQDSLQLTDGRFITGPKMSRDDEGVTLHLEAGDILVPADMVKEASVADDSVANASLSAKDRKRIERGQVKFEGKWMSKKQRDEKVAKRSEEIRKQIEEALKRSKWDNRYSMESKHFKFQYTIDPDIMNWWAELMDEYYDVFSKFWGGLRRPQGQGKLDVMFFHDHDYYDQVTGMPGTGGFFRFVPPLELNFYYDRLDEAWTMNVMFHEANHYLCWLIEPKYNYPNWIEEGLAEYYAASKWDPKKKKLTVGGLLEGRLAGVQADILADRWVTFEDMMPYPNIPGQYYGWAWTFIHFMMNSKYEKRFKKMFRAMPKDKKLERDRTNYGNGWVMTRHTPESQKQFLKTYLKVKDLEAFQQEWYDYIKQLEPASAQGFYQFGRRALQEGMPIKATKMFEKATEMGYESPMLHLQYATALMRKPKKDKSARTVDYRLAKEQYEKAIELDPVDPLTRAKYASFLNSKGRYEDRTDPGVETQRSLANELGNAVNGGAESYSVFLALDWVPYDSSKNRKKGEDEGDGDGE